ncbi:MAG: sulfotransferase [Chromatocurvus sp.]
MQQDNMAAGENGNQGTALKALREDIQQKRFSAALQRSGDLLDATRVASHEVFALRGKAFEGLHRSEDALAVYLKGLEQHSDNARLHLYAGHAYTRAGRSQSAVAHFHNALKLSPSLLDAYRGLLNFEAIDPDSRDAARILAVALNDSRSAMDRARACYLLGQISVDAARDIIGFTYYRRANHIAGRGFNANQREFVVPPTTLAIRHRHFRAVAGTSASGNDCPAIIVAGLPRSGKSLVETLLAGHPDLFAGGELAFVRRFVSKLDTSRDIDDLGAALRRDAAKNPGGSALAQRYREFAGRARPDHPPRYVIDTSPANLRRVGYLSLLHPGVPIVFCRRDPLDLAVALYFKHFKTGHGYSYSLGAIGRAIARSEQLMQHWLCELPNPMATVHYESLSRDPAGTLQALQRELNLDLEPVEYAGAAGTQISDNAESIDWRLFTARSIDARGSIRPDLIGFGRRFERQMRAAMEAYDRELITACDRS